MLAHTAMPEQTPLPDAHPTTEAGSIERDMSPLPDGEYDGNWGRDRIAEILDAPPGHVHDVAWGDGVRYQVGRDLDTSSQLEVFPETGVVRLTSLSAQLTLFRQPPPSLYSDRVRFEQVGPDGQLDLTLTRHGRMRLDLTPALPAVDAQRSESASTVPASLPTGPRAAVADMATTGTDIDGTDDPASVQRATRAVGEHGALPLAPDTVAPIVAHSGGAEGSDSTADAPAVADHADDDRAVVAAVDSDAQAVEQPKAERLELGGRLGRLPSFRTTRSGRLIATFPLAVRDEAGITTWHTVLAFDERAEHLREGLAKGQFVEVIGYQHTRERQTRTGEPRTIVELYATVIKPR